MRTKTYYQYFTNVTHATCAGCLGWHGRISDDPSEFPDREDGCQRVVLPFGRAELDGRREMERDMRRLALSELERRRLFAEATGILCVDVERAVALFARAVEIEVYVADLERLVEETSTFLRSDPGLSARLGSLFSAAFSDKFARARYERFPEGMRYAHERAGLARIQELFP